MRTLYNPVGTPLKRQRQELSEDEMRAKCSPIYAESPLVEVSDKYDFVPTYKIMEGVRQLGFVPVEVRASYVRKGSDREGFQGHQVRMMHVDQLGQPQEVGKPIPELLLNNSHDRSQSFNATAGLFSPICANGLCIPIADIGGIRAKHINLDVHEVVQGIAHLAKNLPLVPEMVNEAKGKIIDVEARVEIIEAGVQARWGSIAQLPSGVTPQHIYKVKREVEKEHNAWNVMNVIQENIIVGGSRYQDDKGANRKVRPTKCVATQNKVNNALWEAMKEAMLKAG